jgi:dephospho-CoA kinase
MPGQPAYDDVVRRFGPAVVAADGALDRSALAEVVFADPVALADLNAIVHPAVREAIARRLADLAGTDAVVVLEIPLLVESGRLYGAGTVVVVDCPEEVAIRRLADGRGMSEPDVRRRMAAQASRADRLAAADVVVDNAGPPEALPPQVDHLWAHLSPPTGDIRHRPDDVG